MRVGVLTGGGDCPGLNAVIRAIVRKAERHYGDSVIGFLDGWRGVLEGEFIEVDVEHMRGTLPRGGTVLGTSRMSPRMYEDGIERVRAAMDSTGTDALIVIGGEGTLSAGVGVYEAGAANVVGVPKTIDNDIGLTELTFGFDTAVEHRHRSHRPTAHHCGISRPGDGGGGYGPQCGAYRHLGRYCRRGHPHLDS